MKSLWMGFAFNWFGENKSCHTNLSQSEQDILHFILNHIINSNLPTSRFFLKIKRAVGSLVKVTLKSCE